MITTAERLATYYPFDDKVLEVVGDIAEQQQQMSWDGFLKLCGVEEPMRTVYEDKATEFIEFRPRGDFDEAKARVFHTSMANPLDGNNAYQAATVFAADPTSRLIVAANPSGWGHRAGLLDRHDRAEVAKGDLRSTVEPTLRLLADKGVTSVVHIGGSYGAEKSMVAAQHAARYGHEVHQAVVYDPPTVIKRSLGKLGLDFMSTNAHLGEYVEASDSPAFEEARKHSVGAVGFPAGLARLTNIAVARGLTHELFETRTRAAFAVNPDMKATISWGSDSELVNDDRVSGVVTRLQIAHPGQVNAMRLPGQYHAAMNDIHLQAAIALQATRNSEQ